MSKWRFSAGARPHTVTVFERVAGGVLYARVWDASAASGKGNWHLRSLGHRNRASAKRFAIEQAAKLQRGEASEGRVMLAQVLAVYLVHRTTRKAKSEQEADKRRVELWSRVLGNMDPHNVSLAQWQGMIDARKAGAIDARGKPVPEGERKKVRARTVEADCIFLMLVFNWASKWRLASGRYLMRENPVRGYEMPHEKNPLRPVATHDRFEAIRAVSDLVMMEIRPNGKRIECRSYLTEQLDIVNGTARRITAVCSLRFDDLRLERTKSAPHGSIVWPEDTDKTGTQTVIPMSPQVRAAIDRVVAERPGIGFVPLFPSPTDPSEPMSRHLADAWLRKAERLAKLEPQKGSLWHAYRRKWATERKHLPDKDVAQAGGWASLESLKKSYQQADEATMLHVVMSGGELREAK